jgi:hypothetical protein
MAHSQRVDGFALRLQDNCAVRVRQPENHVEISQQVTSETHAFLLMMATLVMFSFHVDHVVISLQAIHSLIHHCSPSPAPFSSLPAEAYAFSRFLRRRVHPPSAIPMETALRGCNQRLWSLPSDSKISVKIA